MRFPTYRHEPSRRGQARGPLSSAVVSIGGSQNDANTISGAESGAEIGGSVGGGYGAVIGGIIGAIAGSGGTNWPWATPEQIGNFAYSLVSYFLEKGTSGESMPWDVPDQISDFNSWVDQAIAQALTTRPDILTWGDNANGVQSTGEMHPEVEAMCFVFAQLAGCIYQYGAVEGMLFMADALTIDLGSLGEGLLYGMRFWMQQIVLATTHPAPMQFAATGAAASASQSISVLWNLKGTAKAKAATVATVGRRTAPATAQGSTLPLLAVVAAAALLL